MSTTRPADELGVIGFRAARTEGGLGTDSDFYSILIVNVVSEISLPLHADFLLCKYDLKDSIRIRTHTS